MYQCPDHPKYRGSTEIKRLEKCQGCKKVRESWLAGFKKRKNKGSGSQFSVTSPGFRCGVVHLMAEMGTIILYGQQPAYFWRKATKADPRAKAHYSKTYNLLNIRFNQNPDIVKNLSQVLWLAWEKDFHEVSRQNEQKITMVEDDIDEQAVCTNSHLGHVHLNPLLEEDINGEEDEEENRSF